MAKLEKISIFDWWTFRLLRLVRPSHLLVLGLHDIRVLFRSAQVPDGILKTEEALSAWLDKPRELDKTESLLQKNFRSLGRLLGLSAPVSDWLLFACYSGGMDRGLNICGINYSSTYTFLRNASGFGLTAEEKQELLRRWSDLDPNHLPEWTERGVLSSFKDHGGYQSSAFATSANFTSVYTKLPDLFAAGKRLTKAQILSIFVSPLKPSKLKQQDFQHIQSDLLVDYLKQAARKNTKGANVLVYGSPGTGKTEFVKWLSVQTGLDFFHSNEPAANAGAILQRVQMSENFLRHYTKGVLVVDEAEDVFTDTNYANVLITTGERTGKGMLNAFLETNEVPIIWICNQRHVIDPAIRRRCSIVLEIDRLPEQARLRAIRKHTHGLSVSTEWKTTVAKNEQLTVADIGSACGAVKLAGNRKGAVAETAIEDILRAKLKEREQSVDVKPKQRTPVQYDLTFVNADADLNLVSQAVQQGRTGRFCFYGLPGTGKTEFVRYVAQQTQRRLIEKPASTLLDMYVGQTERNIARAFAEANEAGSILLIDEADSFLQNREGARQSWEVTQVNELLVQMEKFNGTLICCTNLIDGIDPAAFRRFDLKVKFSPLKASQTEAMLALVAGSLDAQARRRVGKLRSCTPGDIAAAVRSFSFLRETLSADTLLDRLEQELRFKPEAKTRSIGF